ncbi:hypothetical protein PMAYCL1PPCAC_19103, partial [Pristionchus mayeri]
SAFIKIVAFGCILAVNGAELARDKRQLLIDSMGPSVVDPYVDPMFAPVPRVVYRRPTVVLQRPSFYPEIYSRPLVRAYRPVYREVLPQVYAEPQPLIVRRPTLAVAAPVSPATTDSIKLVLFSQVNSQLVAPAVTADILIKKKKL